MRLGYWFGRGRLGREVVLLLRAHGHTVVGADVVAAPTTEILLDIRDAPAVLVATRGMVAIVHILLLCSSAYSQHS